MAQVSLEKTEGHGIVFPEAVQLESVTDNTRPTLLERLRDGSDPVAWDEFFKRYWPVVYAYARRRGSSEETAEDIVQDVLLRVFEEKEVFRYEPQRGRFRDWLRTLVRNRVAEYRRRPSERIHPGSIPLEDGPAPPDADASPDESWERAFEKTLLLALLDVVRREVHPRDYLAFELLAIHELSGKEAARITGLTRNAAYKACRRVLRRLRSLGGTYGDDGQLTREVKEALSLRPGAPVERALTPEVEKTMRSR